MISMNIFNNKKKRKWRREVESQHSEREGERENSYFISSKKGASEFIVSTYCKYGHDFAS